MYKTLLIALACWLTLALGIPTGEGKHCHLWVNHFSRVTSSFFSSAPTSTKHQNHFSYNYSQSAKQEWKCVNNVCEEVITRCKNGVCETNTKNQIDAQVFKPEVLHLDPPPFDVQDYHSSVQQSWRCVGNDCQETVTICKNGECTKKITSFNGEGFKPAIPNVIPSGGTTNVDNAAPTGSGIDYTWNNSEQITKKCHNNFCTTLIKTCTNGECQEKVVTDKI